MFIPYLFLSGSEIAVTEKGVFGITAFGKRVDLPMDSISAIGMSMFKGISVATSSGKVRFIFIENRDEIYDVIWDLIMRRQDSSQTKSATFSQSNAEEIKQFKELLDMGIISQEEFDAKKKQLLGL